MIKIALKKVNEGVLFEAENARGHKVRIEGDEKIGGTNSAPAPTEYLVISHMSCTAIDIVELLKKMRQPLDHLEIESTALRAEDQVPRIITDIHLHFKIYGNVTPEKAEKAITMSVEKYCTVSKMIDQVAKIITSFEILPSSQIPKNDE